MKTILLLTLIYFSNIGITISQDSLNTSKEENFFHKNNLKYNLVSLLFYQQEFSYERLIFDKQSINIALGFISASLLPDNKIVLNQSSANPINTSIPRVGRGLFFNLGYRFYFKNSSKYRYPITEGFYLEPNFIYGQYKTQSVSLEDPQNIIRIHQSKVNYRGILFNLGFQGSIGKRILIDMFGSLGFGNDNLNLDDNCLLLCFEPHRGLFKFSQGKSLALRIGVKIGLGF